jgi:hypothetical protein
MRHCRRGRLQTYMMCGHLLSQLKKLHAGMTSRRPCYCDECSCAISILEHLLQLVAFYRKVSSSKRQTNECSCLVAVAPSLVPVPIILTAQLQKHFSSHQSYTDACMLH